VFCAAAANPIVARQQPNALTKKDVDHFMTDYILQLVDTQSLFCDRRWTP
jgi:hypothetical protein